MTDNFGGLEKKYSEYCSSKYVILPVPYDETSTWVKGADKGPLRIIEASSNMELYDIETGAEIFKKGIHTLPFLEIRKDPDVLFELIRSNVKQLLDENKFSVVIGGNHTVSIGAMKAHIDFFENVTILQLDAHADMRETYNGSKYNHACVMARVKEWTKPVLAGIRSMDSSEIPNVKEAIIFYADELLNDPGCVNEILGFLTENVYITIDLDVFDPSIMPSTGTPEPGGLTWYGVINLLKKTAQNRNIVGFDVVELCPNPYNKAPDFLAAKLIYTLMTYIDVYSS
ncbi:agmatinase [candidate division KSB1 bacterium]